MSVVSDIVTPSESAVVQRHHSMCNEHQPGKLRVGTDILDVSNNRLLCSLIEQAFIEHLLRTRYYSRLWGQSCEQNNSMWGFQGRDKERCTCEVSLMRINYGDKESRD